MKICNLFVAGLAGTVLGGSAVAADLSAVVEQRIAADRSGVCLVATRIEQTVEHAAGCADADSARGLDENSRFEIGSISKALQGLLVASLVEDGELDLEQPLSAILGSDQTVSGSSDNPIRIKHLLTHTAGLPRLPPGFMPEDMNNPYAAVSRDDLLAALGRTELESAPGERFAYSNFGAMLLSVALVEHIGQPLAEQLQQRVFEPLDMADTSMTGTTVSGHDANGAPVSNWDFDPDLGGVGAIRSTPADMARWLSALLSPQGSPIAAALIRSREALIDAGGQTVGYGWLHLPLNDQVVLAHDGGTGGFSSFAAVDLDNERAALVLMDTSMLLQGSLGDLAFHLIDPEIPLGEPSRPASAAEGETLDDYAGQFALYDGDEPFMGDFTLDFSVNQGELLIQASVGGQVQPQIPLTSEGAGRFVQKDLDLAIEFLRDESGRVHGLDFQQGPLTLRGQRD